jgi:hypothetical protein
MLPIPNSGEADFQVAINVGGPEVIFNNSRIRFDRPIVQRSLGHSQMAASGSSFVTLTGYLFGDSSSTPKMQVGSTMSSGSVWLSSSSLRGKVPAGFGCKLPGTVSFYRGVTGSILSAFSYNPKIVAATTRTTFPTSGATSVTIVGAGLGVRRSPGSVSAKLGSSTCITSVWASQSHIACKMSPGGGHIFQVVSTAPGASTCSIVTGSLLYPRTISYDSPSISAVKYFSPTFPATGSSQISLFGAGLSTFNACPKARLGYSAVVTTRWMSQSALLGKLPVSRASTSTYVIASMPAQVPPIPIGTNFIKGVVRSVLTGLPVPDTRVSLVFDGIVRAVVIPDSNGYFVFPGLPNADFIVATYSPGLAPLAATVSSSSPPQNYTAAPAPSLGIRQSRIVLTWATFPADLDAQLRLPDGCTV